MIVEEVVRLFCQGCIFAINLFLMWQHKNRDGENTP